MQPLWTPDNNKIKQNHAFRFWNRISQKYGVNIDGFHDLYNWSIDQNEMFWSEVWDEFDLLGIKGSTITERASHPIDTKFFPEARLNFAANLLKQSQNSSSRPKTALSFWQESTHIENISYKELLIEVDFLRNKFLSAQIQPGDVIAALIPNCPLAVIGMLAATSIGAIWTSCSPDFGEAGVIDRFGQTTPKILISVKEYQFKKAPVSLAEKATNVAQAIPSVKHLWFESDCRLGKGSAQTDVDSIDITAWPLFAFDQPLVILYSSGTTGKPKCIVHRAGGVLIEHVKELGLHVSLSGKEVIFYQTTCGWMMWNFLVSGLFFGAKIILYDGSPVERRGTLLFEIAEKERISVFGTNAKWLGIIQKLGLVPRELFDLSAIETILSTGSPLSEDQFAYVNRAISNTACLSSISGGTDILGCFALGTATLPVYKGELQTRSLGLAVSVWDEHQKNIVDQTGELVCLNPFPSQPLMFWGDSKKEKMHEAYYKNGQSVWNHGDFVKLTPRGSMVFYGRSDAVLNPGGVRIGTAEIYAQVEKIPAVDESVVVGKSVDGDIEVLLFVTLKDAATLTEALKTEIKRVIRTNTTAFHVPKHIIQVPDIPKTKNGKLVELAVADIVNGRMVRNTDALQNPESLEAFYQYAKTLPS